MSHVTLAGDIDGDYVVEEQLPDGRLVLRPDTSIEAIRRRTGSRPMSAEEFDMHFGHLPTDARVTHAADLPAELLDRGDLEAESHVMVERCDGRLGVRRLTVAPTSTGAGWSRPRALRAAGGPPRGREPAQLRQSRRWRRR